MPKEINQETVDAIVAEAFQKSTETTADILIAKMFEKAKTNEAKADPVSTRGVETRAFLKALFNNDRNYLKSVEEKAMNGGTEADGGYLVPKELQAEILRISGEYGVARREMRYIPFGGASNSRVIPKLNSSVAVYWTDEGAKKQSTKATFGVITQTLKKLAAIVPFTEELMEDTEIDIVKLLAELIVEAVEAEEDTQYFMGTGTPWTGLLNTVGIPSIAIATGTTFADITASDLLAMQGKVKKKARATAKYYLSSSVMDLVRGLKDYNGQFIFRDVQLTGDVPRLFGKEVVEVDVMPGQDEAVQTNKVFVLFGDLKLGAIYGDKKDLRLKLLTEATVFDVDNSTEINLAQQDMVALRAVKRTGFVVALKEAMCVLKTNAA